MTKISQYEEMLINNTLKIKHLSLVFNQEINAFNKCLTTTYYLFSCEIKEPRPKDGWSKEAQEDKT